MKKGWRSMGIYDHFTIISTITDFYEIIKELSESDIW